MSSSDWREQKPEVVEAREFLEVTRDFTNPKEVVREAISNAIDWVANEIRVIIIEDLTRLIFFNYKIK